LYRPPARARQGPHAPDQLVDERPGAGGQIGIAQGARLVERLIDPGYRERNRDRDTPWPRRPAATGRASKGSHRSVPSLAPRAVGISLQPAACWLTASMARRGGSDPRCESRIHRRDLQLVKRGRVSPSRRVTCLLGPDRLRKSVKEIPQRVFRHRTSIDNLNSMCTTFVTL
jgi:hypothetical protein